MSQKENDSMGRVSLIMRSHCDDVIFYFKGGPYAAFGGRDASRGLATFSVSAKDDEYDDLSDLNTMEMDSVREWEEQFKGKVTFNLIIIFAIILM